MLHGIFGNYKVYVTTHIFTRVEINHIMDIKQVCQEHCEKFSFKFVLIALLITTSCIYLHLILTDE